MKNLIIFLFKMLKEAQFTVGFVVISLFIIAAIFAPFLTRYNPATDQDLQSSLSAPNKHHWFGTDPLGRDVFAQIVYGARISLTVGFLSRIIALIIGGILGVIAGYLGGKIDDFIMRLVDVFLAFPPLLLAMALMAIGEQSIFGVSVALGIAAWAVMARLTRGQVLTVKNLDYVSAAKAQGGSHRRIIFLHILPNCAGPIIVWFTLGLASAVMAEAGLSFLGLSVSSKIPSWGSMIAVGSDYLQVAPWISIFPGIALALIVLSFNLIGDALQETLEPKWSKKTTYKQM